MQFQIGQVKIIIKASGSSVIFPAGDREVIINYQPAMDDEGHEFKVCLFVTKKPDGENASD